MTAVAAPFQWSIYVANHPGRDAIVKSDLVLSRSDLDLANEEVNGRIEPAPGAPPILIGWDENRSPGWCGDYAVTKRALLLRLGWPSSKLLLAHVTTATGEPHAVLVSDDMVLDNRVSNIRHRLKTGYKGVAIQTPDNPNFWCDASSLFR